MGSIERRAREKENLRRAILDAARELFATEDYRAVSMRRIAEKIEYSPTAIYLHFRDKEEILVCLIEEGFEMLHSRLCGVENDDPVEWVRQGGREYLEFAFTQPHYYRLMFQMDNKDRAEEHLPKCGAANGALGCICEAAQRAMERGQFVSGVPPMIVAHSIWSAVHGVACLALSGHLMMLPEEAHHAFFENALNAALRGHLACKGD